MSGSRAGPSRRPSQAYDVAIVGGDLAGLVAGALLAKRGLRVLQVEDGAPEAGAGGYRLPTFPNVLPDPRSLPAFRALLEELGLMPSVGRSIQPYPGGLQLVLPRARLDLAPDPAKREQEVRRAFGPSLGGFSRRWEALEVPITTWLEAAALLPPDGLRERFRLRGPARKLRAAAVEDDGLGPLNPALRELARILAPAEGGEVGFSRTLLPLLSRPGSLEGPGLDQVLRGQIVSRRGELASGVREIAVEKGACAGVHLSGFSEPHRCKVVLAAAPPERIASLLDGTRLGRKVEGVAAGLVPTSRVLTLRLVLDARAIPPGLGRLCLLHGFGTAGLLLCLEPARREDGQEAEGLVTLTASARFPLREDEASAAAAMRTALEEVVPFHGRHLRHESLVDAGTPGIEVEGGGPLGIGGLPLRTPVGRLLWSSSWVLPGLGIEGRILTGMRAAERAAALCKKAP